MLIPFDDCSLIVGRKLCGSQYSQQTENKHFILPFDNIRDYFRWWSHSDVLMEAIICVYNYLLFNMRRNGRYGMKVNLPQWNLIMEFFIFRFWRSLMNSFQSRWLRLVQLSEKPFKTLTFYWSDQICFSFSVVVCACRKNIRDLQMETVESDISLPLCISIKR